LHRKPAHLELPLLAKDGLPPLVCTCTAGRGLPAPEAARVARVQRGGVQSTHAEHGRRRMPHSASSARLALQLVT
jgi:hypothetical protein